LISATAVKYSRNVALLFAAAELQQIRRYCKRNQPTRELLQYPIVCGSDAHGDEAKTPLFLFPKYFEVTKPARNKVHGERLGSLLLHDQ
jgi:hypothetical protein